MGLLSSRNNFVCKNKEIRNLPSRILESNWRAQEKKRLKERIQPVTQNKNWWQNKESLSYTANLLSHETSFYPQLINKLSLHPSIVQTFFVPPAYCLTHLLFKPSFVLHIYCSILLPPPYCFITPLFYISFALFFYCPIFCHFTRLYLSTLMSLYSSNSLLFHSSIAKQRSCLS